MVKLQTGVLITLCIVIFVPAVSADAARNPMGYWYGWAEVAEKDPAVDEISFDWETADPRPYWCINIVLDSVTIEQERLLLFNTGITREMCNKALFGMALTVSLSDESRSWRGYCEKRGDGFYADDSVDSNDPDIAPVFSEDTGTYLIRVWKITK